MPAGGVVRALRLVGAGRCQGRGRGKAGVEQGARRCAGCWPGSVPWSVRWVPPRVSAWESWVARIQTHVWAPTFEGSCPIVYQDSEKKGGGGIWRRPPPDPFSGAVGTPFLAYSRRVRGMAARRRRRRSDWGALGCGGRGPRAWDWDWASSLAFYPKTRTSTRPDAIPKAHGSGAFWV